MLVVVVAVIVVVVVVLAVLLVVGPRSNQHPGGGHCLFLWRTAFDAPVPRGWPGGVGVARRNEAKGVQPQT